MNISNVLKNLEMENLNNCLFTYHELKGVGFPRSSEFFIASNLFQDYFPPFLFVNWLKLSLIYSLFTC